MKNNKIDCGTTALIVLMVMVTIFLLVVYPAQIIMFIKDIADILRGG